MKVFVLSSLSCYNKKASNCMLMCFMGNIIQDFSNFQQARQKNCTEWPRRLFAFLQIELWSFVNLFKNKYVLLLSWYHVLRKIRFAD